MIWLNFCELDDDQVEQVYNVYPDMKGDALLLERTDFPFHDDLETLRTDIDPIENIDMARLQYEEGQRISSEDYPFFLQAARLGSLG